MGKAVAAVPYKEYIKLNMVREAGRKKKKKQAYAYIRL